MKETWGLLWSFCSSLCSMFHPSRGKHAHHLLYVASYVMMHSAISTHCYTVPLKMNQPIFFPPTFSIHFIWTMHWMQWSSSGTKNRVGIMMLFHFSALIYILFEGEWSSILHSKRADSTASGWVHRLRHKRAAVCSDRKCRQFRTLYS